MIRLACIPVTGQCGIEFRSPGAGRLFRFKDDVCGALPEGDPPSLCIERFAWLFVEDLQCVESIDVKDGQRFGPAGNDPVEVSLPDQPRAEKDGIRRRGAGRADGRAVTLYPKRMCDLFGAVGTIVDLDKSVQGVVGKEILVILFALVHATNGGG